jgi:hypothetical protein
MEWLAGCRVWGFDIDKRLIGFPNLTVGDSLELMHPGYSVVTAIDVIEHVENDRQFFSELCQISRKAVYISTPNVLHSGCQNEHHAREYSCTEFGLLFKPDELWGGTADGWRREKLEKPYSEEWPSMMGVFYVS